MVEPLVIGNLIGTGEDDFAIGQEGQGVRKADGEIALYDAVSGQKKLSELLAATNEGYSRYYIGSAETVTVPEYRQYVNFQRVVLDGILHVDGQGVIL